MKPNAIFVTGTDTGVGKTVVTGLLARLLKEKGYRVITQKWVQTGSSGFSADIDAHLAIMGANRNHIKKYLPHVSPYMFKEPCSPHFASKIGGKKISAEKIKRSFEVLSREFDFVIVEGVGGALVPFNGKRLVIDIAKELALPVVVVAGNKLGGINHTLLTIEALKNRKMKLSGVIFNNAKGEDKKILVDNPRIIQSLSREKLLGVLPWIQGCDRLYKKFIPIGQRLLKVIDNM
jgi:dethiobiotin synthetase